MISLPDFLVFASVLALVGTYVWIIHRMIRAMERANDHVTKPKT